MADDLRMTVSELRQHMESGEKFTMVDSRNPHAWGEATNKAPNAIRVPAEEVKAHLAEIPKDTPVVIYCT